MILNDKKCRKCLARFVCAFNITTKTVNCKNVQKHIEKLKEEVRSAKDKER